MMNSTKIEREIIKSVEQKLSPESFRLIDHKLGNSEYYAAFVNERGEHSYYFSLTFLHPGKSEIKIEPFIILTNKRITEIMKAVGRDVGPRGFYAISTPLGNYINEKNSDGFSNSNHTILIDVEQSAPGIEAAVHHLYSRYFIGGALKFVTETDSLAKIDQLINQTALDNSDQPIRPRVHFGSNRPWQILTGIIAAKLVNRPDYGKLEAKYLDFAADFKSGEVRAIDEFRKVIEYFKNRSV